MKNNRHGQAEILNDVELDRIYKQLQSDSHKLFFKIARYTGERFGAICQLQVCDLFSCNSGLADPLTEITFQAQTRKGSPNGKRETRQMIVVEPLRDYLIRYHPAMGEKWLFPSPIKADKPISFSASDKWLRTAVDRAGLGHRGISTHSFRRSFITKLYRDKALDIHAIMKIMGHKNIATTQRYIGLSSQDLLIALNSAFS